MGPKGRRDADLGSESIGFRVSHKHQNILSTESHLRIRKTIQCSEENLISNAVVIRDMEDFCETDLPWWVAGEFHRGAK